MMPPSSTTPVTAENGWWIELSASGLYGQQQCSDSPEGRLPESQKAIQGEKKWLCPFAPGIRMSGRGAGAEGSCSSALSPHRSHFWHTPISFCCADPGQLPGLSTFCCRKCWAFSHRAPQQPPPCYCSWSNHMSTALSKTYELDVNFDFEDFPGLPFFLMCLTWALSPLHIHVAQSLWSGFAEQGLESHLLTTSSFFPPPSLPEHLQPPAEGPACALHRPDCPQHLLFFAVLPALPGCSPASLQPCSNSWCSLRNSLLCKLFLSTQGLLGRGCKLGKPWKIFQFSVHLRARRDPPHPCIHEKTSGFPSSGRISPLISSMHYFIRIMRVYRNADGNELTQV